MKIFEKTKIWLIIALVIVVAGVALLSIFGLNQTADYKTAYEVTVGVDQDVKGSGELVKQTAENYFAEKGYKFSAYATQKAEDGTVYIYKFNGKGEITQTELKDRLTAALNGNAELAGLGLVAKAEYKQTAVTSGVNLTGVMIACVIALALAFVVSWIMIKLSGALTLLCNSVIAALVYVSLIAITRLPALPNLVICAAASMIITAVITFVMINRFKEMGKNGGDVKAIAKEGANKSFIRICFIVCVGALAAIALSATTSVYLAFTGLHILAATVSAALVSLIATPAFWSAFKAVGSKK
ncbi:MAG: hypothetical protein IJU83_04590 [Clostridia bacterium]|nr:hypothetical protein [Clostridia bacterium]